MRGELVGLDVCLHIKKRNINTVFDVEGKKGVNIYNAHKRKRNNPRQQVPA